MLSTKNRFHGHGSLNYLFRNGRVFRSQRFILRFVENKRRHDSRFSVIVGKKISKSAVVRNRIRRRVYEIVRTNLQNLPEQVDVAITVLSVEVAVMPSQELHDVLLAQLERAGLYKTAR